MGKSIEGAEIDEETGELRWELITPGGVLLEFGPGVRWQISSATDSVSARR